MAITESIRDRKRRVEKARRRGHPIRNVRRDRSKDVFLVALVDERGQTRASVHKRVTGDTLKATLDANVDKSRAWLSTDEANPYTEIGREFRGHGRVNHSIREWTPWGLASTNRCESFFSLFKRGIYGIYHSVSPAYLGLYASEFEWRANRRTISDGERVWELVRSAEGKRLRRNLRRATWVTPSVSRGVVVFGLRRSDRSLRPSQPPPEDRVPRSGGVREGESYVRRWSGYQALRKRLTCRTKIHPSDR